MTETEQRRAGRPRRTREHTVLTQVLLPESVRDALEDRAHRDRVPMTRVVIEALRDKLGLPE